MPCSAGVMLDRILLLLLALLLLIAAAVSLGSVFLATTGADDGDASSELFQIDRIIGMQKFHVELSSRTLAAQHLKLYSHMSQ
jgi:hypothetical protein